MSSGALRIDVLTIFPDYLRVLDLSLIGKASSDGLIDLAVRDLRDWTHDRHRTVDDTPLGGGAGMVMKPDVWGEALDDVLGLPADAVQARAALAEKGERPVLIIPTPSGEVFTQRTAEELAGASRIAFACGRYEGIDGRVAEHYRAAGVDVRELSIGDYVLNGGEVAALVIIEAVARLRPGVLGNPESVVEESHSQAGLLEYAVHTRPVAWRGLDVSETWPALLSGDHERIARERRDQAIARTCARRPDMVARLAVGSLDSADRAALARHGWAAPLGAEHPIPLVLRPARREDAEALSELARRTFPDACPPFLTAEQVAAHMAVNLSPERFAAWIADPRVLVTIAELPDGAAGLPDPVLPGEPVGYGAVVEHLRDEAGEEPAGLDEMPRCVEVAPAADGGAGLAAELSKVYVDSRLRSSGIAQALVARARSDAAAAGVTTLWLGTHEGNKRAQKAYKRSGFRKAGARRYNVGGQLCRDVVMSLDPRQDAHGS